MNAAPKFEKTETYINLNVSPAADRPEPEPGPPFITFSREAGAGASSLARLIGARLNRDPANAKSPWHVYDGNLVEAMLRDLNYPKRLARYLPEDSISELDASIGELVGLHPNLWELVQHTNCLIRQLAGQGKCILIGRGANFATKELPSGLHIRLIGTREDRAKHMAKLLKIDLRTAYARNAKADIARRRYVRRHFDHYIDDPDGYDLVINTSRIELPHAAEMIAALVTTRCASAKA